MEQYIYFGSIITLFGLLIGSFLNVCIYRIPIKESIVHGNSHCPNCSKKIKPYDLIPAFSYLFLGGKCRNCKSKISFRYPLIELINCILYALVYLQFGASLKTILLCAVASTLVVVALIDIDTKEIPNGLVIFLLCLAPIGFYLNDMPFWYRIIGFFAASGILMILSIFTGGFGGGDIKLMAACGILIGFPNILIGLFIGCVVGGIYAVILLVTKKAKKGAEIPFGPSLSVGVFLAAVYGDQILNWYLSLLQLT